MLRHPSTARGWDSTLRIGRMESIHGRKKMIFNMLQQDFSWHGAGKSWWSTHGSEEWFSQQKSLMSWFFYGRSLLQAIPTMSWNPRGLGWNNPSCPFISAIFRVYNYCNSIYNDGLQGPPCRISQFKGKWISDQVLTSGVKDDQSWTSPRKQWHYYSHSLKLWNRIWMMFAFHLLHPFPNLRLCIL